MVQPLVPFRASGHLIIFQISYTTVYLTQAVVPQHIVCCIPALPGTGKFYREIPLQVNVPHVASDAT